MTPSVSCQEYVVSRRSSGTIGFHRRGAEFGVIHNQLAIMTDAGSSKEIQFDRRVPAGDTHERLVCSHCEFVHYENPKVIVGAVVTAGDRYLLCKRAIEPRLGYWTLPAGFLELSETTEDGARREAWEEALAKIHIDAFLGIYNVPHISQVQIFYRATLENPDTIGAGEESEAVRLLPYDDIPWADLAFSSVRWALESAKSVEGRKTFPPFQAVAQQGY